MEDLLSRRLDFAEVFASKHEPVAALVESSGGYARDLLRLAQYSLQIAGRLPVSIKHVEAAIAKLKRSYLRGYSTDYADLLAYVAQQRPTVIPAELTAAIEEVIDGHFAMIYGNDKDWYDVHPLVGALLREDALPPPARVQPATLPATPSGPVLPGAGKALQPLAGAAGAESHAGKGR
jgi:hypothetical protein